MPNFPPPFSLSREAPFWNIRTWLVSGTTIKTTKNSPIKSWANGRTRPSWYLFWIPSYSAISLLYILPPPFFSVFYVLRKNEAESNFSLLHSNTEPVLVYHHASVEREILKSSDYILHNLNTQGRCYRGAMSAISPLDFGESLYCNSIDFEHFEFIVRDSGLQV